MPCHTPYPWTLGQSVRIGPKLVLEVVHVSTRGYMLWSQTSGWYFTFKGEVLQATRHWSK